MQIQKQETKDRILQAAKQEFLKQGYQHASMRNIAQISEMTVGNIYSYFRNKDALFQAVVAPTVEELNQFILGSGIPSGRTFPIREIAEALADIYRRNQEQFMILMAGSRGSAYENAKEDLSGFILRRIRLESAEYPALAGKSELFYQSLTHSLLEGILYILLHSDPQKDPAHLQEALSQFLQFLFSSAAILE